jgi:hypothetical protein
LICIVWFKIMTVNQRVAGSSPAGGARKPGVFTSGFFIFLSLKDYRPRVAWTS